MSLFFNHLKRYNRHFKIIRQLFRGYTGLIKIEGDILEAEPFLGSYRQIINDLITTFTQPKLAGTIGKGSL